MSDTLQAELIERATSSASRDPSDVMRVAVLGAGGLGRAAARIIGMKREARLVAICDSRGVVSAPEGLDSELISRCAGDLVEGAQRCLNDRTPGSGGAAPSARATASGRGLAQDSAPHASLCGAERAGLHTEVTARHSHDPLAEILAMSGSFDGILVCLPNLPNEFIPGVIERFTRAVPSLAMVDVLKRTGAVAQMFALDPIVKQARGVVLTGCGATPGLLAAAAVLAAQSFIEVERVDIRWGVGIANWDAYKATIREDIAHLPGYTVERARAMSEEEIETLLARTNGCLEFQRMEHADDLLLQRVGVVDRREQVTVGGVMDTRHPTKPVTTTMTLTGITCDGKRSSHRFLLGDETTMAANVIGPALGYLKRALWLKHHGLFGVYGCTDFLPMVVR